jgi:hypothetical protein
MPADNGVAVTYAHIRRSHAFHQFSLEQLSALADIRIDSLKGYYRGVRNGPLPDTAPAQRLVETLKGMGFKFLEKDQVLFYPESNMSHSNES